MFCKRETLPEANTSKLSFFYVPRRHPFRPNQITHDRSPLWTIVCGGRSLLQHQSKQLPQIGRITTYFSLALRMTSGVDTQNTCTGSFCSLGHSPIFFCKSRHRTGFRYPWSPPSRPGIPPRSWRRRPRSFSIRCLPFHITIGTDR